MKDVTYINSEAYQKGYADAIKWHDAKKEKPESLVWVLCSAKFEEPFIGYYSEVNGQWFANYGTLIKPMYWMEIPELPEKEESK